MSPIGSCFPCFIFKCVTQAEPTHMKPQRCSRVRAGSTAAAGTSCCVLLLSTGPCWSPSSAAMHVHSEHAGTPACHSLQSRQSFGPLVTPGRKSQCVRVPKCVTAFRKGLRGASRLQDKGICGHTRWHCGPRLTQHTHSRVHRPRLSPHPPLLGVGHDNRPSSQRPGKAVLPCSLVRDSRGQGASRPSLGPAPTPVPGPCLRDVSQRTHHFQNLRMLCSSSEIVTRSWKL